VETIGYVGRTLGVELDTQKLVQTVTDATTELTGAQFGAFFYNVTDPSGQSYSLYAIAGVDRSKFENFPMPRATELFGPTFRGEGPIRIDDVTKDSRYGKNAPNKGMPQGHLPVHSYLAAPVVSRSGEVLGGLFFGHERVGVFDERDEQLLVGIAAQAAIAIDNARLFESATHANAQKDALLARERAARSDAEKANRMKDEFLSIVSHELRTPLNAILGWSQILRATPTSNPDLQEGLDVIERNARVQAQIIEDLLDMSRIISGKVRLDVQRVDLVTVIDAAIESMQPAADAKGVKLYKVLDPLTGPVTGDPSRLQQVIWNLISNAIKFTSSGGRVAVTLERVNSHVEISVSDTGEGIKPVFLPYVFDRFRQAEGATTRRHGGLGLGLSIVKQLTELHGGTVSAKSPGEGHGATFRVALPLTPLRPQDDVEQRRHPKADKANSNGETRWQTPSLRDVAVLLVDDEPDSRRLVARVLEQCDATVTQAASAEEALKLLVESKFNIIVSDIGMPNMDGYELVRRVRGMNVDGAARIPAVALTAFARSEDRTRAMLCGFDLHIAKPVEPGELCAVVARLAGKAGTESAPAATQT
jgi:signal transduction histidine kinase/CheY-like chemotaxis protein